MKKAIGLRRYRKSKGFKLSTLAKLAGISTGFLSEIERGRKKPSVTTLVNLAEAYGVTPSTILILFQETEELCGS